jgi:hypothetical protein
VRYRSGSGRGSRRAASFIDDEAGCDVWEDGDDVKCTDDESEEEEEEVEGGESGLSGSEIVTRRNWRRAGNRLDGDLLRGTAAGRMEAHELAPRKPGELGYMGIGIDETSNCDMARIWDTQF